MVWRTNSNVKRGGPAQGGPDVGATPTCLAVARQAFSSVLLAKVPSQHKRTEPSIKHFSARCCPALEVNLKAFSTLEIRATGWTDAALSEAPHKEEPLRESGRGGSRRRLVGADAE